MNKKRVKPAQILDATEVTIKKEYLKMLDSLKLRKEIRKRALNKLK